MSKLEKAYIALQEMERHASDAQQIDPRINLIVTILFLVAMLSVGMQNLPMLIWFALYPILASAWLGIGFGGIFLKSLYVLPLVALIGIFNPILDRQPVLFIGSLSISGGWISFMAIILRGLLAMQAILLLIASCGFSGMCRGMRRLGVPAFLTDQLLFVSRYMSVLLMEAITMQRAREARGFGRKSFPLKLWGTMIGQLFIRAIERSERIHKAMLARGFSGDFPDYSSLREASGEAARGGLKWRDMVYAITFSVMFLILRFVDLTPLFASLALSRT